MEWGMEVIPAIDLRGGRCVRLLQGDYEKETVFSEDPVGMARHWEEQGAPQLHVVDLDGAREGRPANEAIIAAIARAVSIPIQVGGGIRSIEAIERLLAMRVRRVVLGTVAVEEPELVGEACRRFGEAIVVGIDAREGKVAVRGWRKASSMSAVELLQHMAALGVGRFIYTDISRDGTLSGPNLQALRELKRNTALPIIASGGVASLDHLRQLKDISVEGALVGRALYTGQLDLREALRVVK